MPRTKRDKIFDNTFEEQEFEINGNMTFTVDPSRTDSRCEEDKIEENIVMDKIHTLIVGSRFNWFNNVDEFHQTVKLKKIDINNVYDFIDGELRHNHSMIVVFSCLCNYFNVNPTKFYSSLCNKFKEALITELDDATGILSKKNINRLF